MKLKILSELTQLNETAKQFKAKPKSRTKKLQMPVNEETGSDWGSSDWYPVIAGMTTEIESGQHDIEEAALNAAHTYYDSMGYESAEDAVPRIIWMYKKRKGVKNTSERSDADFL